MLILLGGGWLCSAVWPVYWFGNVAGVNCMLTVGAPPNKPSFYLIGEEKPGEEFRPPPTFFVTVKRSRISMSYGFTAKNHQSLPVGKSIARYGWGIKLAVSEVVSQKSILKSYKLRGRPWMFLLVFAAYPIWFILGPLRRERRRRKRLREGHCLNCGYDLRGSDSGVCPECGVASKQT